MPRPQLPSIPDRLDVAFGYTGKGVVMGFVDVGFYPHPDLMRPKRRVKVYADASQDVPAARDFFTPHDYTWHGTMTACCAAGNGYLSGGYYRGLASESDVVLVKAGVEGGRVQGKHIASAIRFPLRHPKLGIQIMNVSLGVPDDDPDKANVEEAVAEVVEAGVVVFAAVGNRPDLLPGAPGSAPAAISLGGLNDRCAETPDDETLYPFSHGEAHPGFPKPDLLAPAIWLPAPMLTGTLVAREAGPLFQLLGVLEEAATEHGFSERHQASTEKERKSVAELMGALQRRIAEQKYITPDYQHVDGTSFASPITASVAAQMLEACPELSPEEIRRGLRETAEPLAGVSSAVQGAGVLKPRLAVEWAEAQSAARASASNE